MSILRASDLDATSRTELIARAEALGIEKADVLTRDELIDEIVKRTVADPIERRLARGLLGVARDLVARVVERGLHLPDAAALIRGLQHVTLTPVTPPIATVTLAEIYAGQGHRSRALAVLDEVLAKEPEHAAARALREKVGSMRDEGAVPSAPSKAPAGHQPTPVHSQAPTPDLGEIQAHDSDLDHDRDRDLDLDRDRDLDRDHDRDHDPSLGLPDSPEHAPDTLPPASDALPTLIPSRRDAGHDALDALMTAAAHFDDAAEPPASGAISPPRQAAPSASEDADCVVLVPVDATSALAYWELRPATLDAACAWAEGGELILRIVAVTPSWDGPRVEVRDVEVEVPAGDWLVSDLPAGAEVRAAIGWRSENGFDPLAVALDVASRAKEQAGALVDAAESAPDSAVARRGAAMEERARARAKLRSAQGCGSSWPTLAVAPWEAPYVPPAPANVGAR
jgi:hypothetical protein